jgi:hypothetical protein
MHRHKIFIPIGIVHIKEVVWACIAAKCSHKMWTCYINFSQFLLSISPWSAPVYIFRITGTRTLNRN